jgi:hypothetical protein
LERRPLAQPEGAESHPESMIVVGLVPLPYPKAATAARRAERGAAQARREDGVMHASDPAVLLAGTTRPAAGDYGGRPRQGPPAPGAARAARRGSAKR